jgi:hypothetical protein
MKFNSIIALCAFTLAGSAAYADDFSVTRDPFVSTRTRAEVQAEVLSARAAGVQQFVTEWEVGVVAVAPAPSSTLTRAQVRAELLKAPRGRAQQENPGA